MSYFNGLQEQEIRGDFPDRRDSACWRALIVFRSILRVLSRLNPVWMYAGIPATEMRPGASARSAAPETEVACDAAGQSHCENPIGRFANGEDEMGRGLHARSCFCRAVLTVFLAGAVAPAGGADGNVPVLERFLDNTEIKAGRLFLQRSHYVALGSSGIPYSGPRDAWVTVLRNDLSPVRRVYPGEPANCRMTRLEYAAFDGGKTLAASILCWQAGREPVNKLVFFDVSSGSALKVLDTQPLKCTALDYAANGELLCLGVDVEKAKAGDLRYPLLHRFDRNGMLLSRSVPRDSLPASRYIERWSDKGQPHVYSWGGSRIVLWFPALAQLIVTDSEGKELWRRQIPAAVPDANYSLGLSGDGRICAFLPDRAAPSRGAGLYQMACLADESGHAILPSRIPGEIQAQWHFSADWAGFERIGVSTVLVGFEGSRAVLWDKTSSSSLITLSSAAGFLPAQQ